VTLETYIRPASIAEALEALAQPGVRPQVVAGGTDYVPMARKMRMNGTLPNGDGPSVLLDLSKLEDLCGVREADGALEIGAATTMGAIVVDPLIKESAPVLVAAAASVGSPLVRNRATVGGNLVTASPSADTAPALLATGAAVRVAGAAGSRELPLSDFFIDYRKTALRSGEILTHVLVPLAGRRGVNSRFEKVGLRNADAISVVCAACEVELDGTTVHAARIGLGAVAPVPVRALAAESALRGRELTAEAAAETARLVHEHISPIDDVRASGRYRGWVAEAVVARMLTQIADEARG